MYVELVKPMPCKGKRIIGQRFEENIKAAFLGWKEGYIRPIWDSLLDWEKQTWRRFLLKMGIEDNFPFGPFAAHKGFLKPAQGAIMLTQPLPTGLICTWNNGDRTTPFPFNYETQADQVNLSNSAIWISTRFQTPSGGNVRITGYAIYMKNVGNLSGTFTVSIFTETASKPTGNGQVTNSDKALDISIIGESFTWVSFQLGSPITLSTSTYYWVVARLTTVASAQVGYGIAGATSYSISSDSGATWGDTSGQSFDYRIYGCQ